MNTAKQVALCAAIGMSTMLASPAARADKHVQIINCSIWELDVTTYNGDDHVRLMGYDSAKLYSPYDKYKSLRDQNKDTLECKGGGKDRCFVSIKVPSDDPNNPADFYDHWLTDGETLRFVQRGSSASADNKDEACPAQS